MAETSDAAAAKAGVANAAEQFERARASKDQGAALYKQEKWREAYDKWVEAIRHLPEGEDNVLSRLHLSLRLNLAQVSLQLKMWAEVVKQASMALKLDQGSSKALYRRGVAQDQLGKIRQAMDDFHKAARLEPRDPEIRKRCEECKAKALELQEDKDSPPVYDVPSLPCREPREDLNDDDGGSTVLMEFDEVSHTSSRSRHRRRKITALKKMQQDSAAAATPTLIANMEAPTVFHKAVQTAETTDSERIESLERKVEALTKLVSGLTESRNAMEFIPSSVSASSSGQDDALNKRLEFLERMEVEHSKMFVLKARSDGEMMDDLSNLKQFCQDMHERVEHCERCLEDSEDDVDSEEMDKELLPVPEEIRRLSLM